MEEGKVTVARILIDSIIDKQGLLRPGDVIVEANGQKIKNPEQLQEVTLFRTQIGHLSNSTIIISLHKTQIVDIFSLQFICVRF